ncbi:hypothetical protein HPB50_024811 [Hyalomma asiaticum]|uniref:Uncharacterized protein n=1 Tax=Hyalomma asiaticum TaxID=266040 RepID=A0ACB7T750_HYAAI|nr:hypothetical protein HPB50_024811 [Hyalomma asiaticum]
MSRVFELAAFCSDLREDAASERGAALGLQGQLVETRREVAVLQRWVHEAESGFPGAVAADLSTRLADAPGLVPAAPQGALSYAAVLAGPGAAARGPRLPGREPAGEVIPEVRQEQHQHVAFLTPTSQTAAPARDVLRLLKANIDPASKGITDATLRHTRYGLTVFSNHEQWIKNIQQAIQENTVTRQMIIVRVPGRRNPHVRFSGIDPDVDSDRFFAMLNERNAGLALNEEHCNVRITFRESSGTSAFIAEVDPESFQQLMARPRLSLGWTMVRVPEELHVPTCTFCATYGHGKTACPHKTDPTKCVCMRCGENHISESCAVRMGDAAVCCAECRRAGRPAEGHPAGFPGCPLLVERVARLKARTNCGPCH